MKMAEIFHRMLILLTLRDFKNTVSILFRDQRFSSGEGWAGTTTQTRTRKILDIYLKQIFLVFRSSAMFMFASSVVLLACGSLASPGRDYYPAKEDQKDPIHIKHRGEVDQVSGEFYSHNPWGCWATILNELYIKGAYNFFYFFQQ